VLWLSRPAALRCDRGISAPNLGRCPWVTTANRCETWAMGASNTTPRQKGQCDTISYEIVRNLYPIDPLESTCKDLPRYRNHNQLWMYSAKTPLFSQTIQLWV
jgi:hypothetical protein